MRKLSEKQLLVLTIAVSVLLTGGLVALILSDTGEIEGIEEEIAVIEQQIAMCDREIDKTKEREEKILVFRAVESRELDILPTQQMIADFFRNLSTYFSAAGINFHQAPESSPNESELAKGIYETRTKLTLAGDAQALLRFMNMVENDGRLIAIKGFRLGAGQKDRLDPNKPIEHDVDLTLATYFYNPSAGNVQRVHIPNEQKRLQEKAIQDAISSFEPERPDTYVLRPSASRRDPFVDPRQERPVEDPALLQERIEREGAIVDGLESTMREVAEMIEQEKALIQAGDLFRADRLGREIDVRINELRAEVQQVVEMKTVTVASLTARVQEVVAWLDTVVGRRPTRDVTVTRTVAEKMLAELEKLFRQGEYAELQNQGNAWDGYVRGKDLTADARSVISRIKALRRRAKNLSDFASLQIGVRAVIIAHKDPTRNVALINGEAHRKGDKLDERGEVVVGRITKTYVWFTFRGEEEFRVRVGGAFESGPKGAKHASGAAAAPVPIGAKPDK